MRLDMGWFPRILTMAHIYCLCSKRVKCLCWPARHPCYMLGYVLSFQVVPKKLFSLSRRREAFSFASFVQHMWLHWWIA